MTNMNGNEITDEERHEKLLRVVKAQLKAIMEESVTKKFIYVESPHVLRLCGTVEQCLLDRLKSHPIFSFNIAYLFTKVGKAIHEVADVVAKIELAEAQLEKISTADDGRRSRPSSISSSSSINGYSAGRKYLWVRMAITEKVIDKVMEHLVTNHDKFYEKSSIMSDPIRGKILSSLLVGPCALDYTKVKTHDHYWSDPPAEELLQRHKLHSRGPPSPCKRPTLHFAPFRQRITSDCVVGGSSFREYVESLHQNSKITLLYGKNNVIVEPEDVGVIPGYLSLHQESSRLLIKWTPNQLMYGSDSESTSSPQSNGVHKNGDFPPKNGKDHKNPDDVRFLKRPLSHNLSADKRSSSSYWSYAISVDVQDIVYLHCHQQEKSSTLVLIGQDGVQWPPIRFPPGCQLLTFLTTLETALLPHGYLDPPLWSQKGKGRMFPRVRRRSYRRSESNNEYAASTDFVFRISTTHDRTDITSSPSPQNVAKSRTTSSNFDLMESILSLPALWTKSFAQPKRKPILSVRSSPNDRLPPTAFRRGSAPRRAISLTTTAMRDGAYECRKCGRHVDPSREMESVLPGTLESAETDDPFANFEVYNWDQHRTRCHSCSNGLSEKHSRSSLKVLCDSMRRQIISRAFYGWLAHCRHISCVRTHLVALVNDRVVPSDTPSDATVGVTDEVWQKLNKDGKLSDFDELSRYVYYGGVQAKHLRKIVWLYLLNYYPPGCSEEERHHIDLQAQKKYEEIRLLDELIKQKVSELASRQFFGSATSINSAVVDSAKSDVFVCETDDVGQQKTLQERLLDIEAELTDVHLRNSTPIRALQERSPTSPKHSQLHVEDSLLPSESTDSSSDANSSSSNASTGAEGDCTATLPNSSKENEIPSPSAESELSRDSVSNGVDEIDKNDVPCNEVNNASVNSSCGSSHAPSLVSYEDPFCANLTQIEKDVYRCDRNHSYFTQSANLTKLGNIMSCFVWEHPDVAYVQGMCDLVAPLLVLFDDESLVYACFVNLMQRIGFSKGSSMDNRLANLRSLVQVLDYELYEHLCKKTDDTHFFFCYRWFLLEFKRELSYDEDVFAMWERTWAARSCSTDDFGLFFGLAMLETYRDIILENEMDFSGIVKFFNEMAEKHKAMALIQMAQKFVSDVQQMIEK